MREGTSGGEKRARLVGCCAVGGVVIMRVTDRQRRVRAIGWDVK